MISSNCYSCHVIPNAQMVKLRLRDIRYEYISERHMADNYLSCGCAEGLSLPFSVCLNHIVISNLPSLHMQMGPYSPTSLRPMGCLIYPPFVKVCLLISILNLIYFWAFANWKIT